MKITNNKDYYLVPNKNRGPEAPRPHEPTRQQERQMRKFKSAGQAQRFLSFHGLVNNLFRQQRHLQSAVHYRILRDKAFNTWNQVVRVKG